MGVLLPHHRSAGCWGPQSSQFVIAGNEVPLGGKDLAVLVHGAAIRVSCLPGSNSSPKQGLPLLPTALKLLLKLRSRKLPRQRSPCRS